MLADFKVSRCTRRCHALSRPLRDGEWFYSVVVEQGDDLARRDYSAEAWTTPPEGSVAWWKSRMPLAGTRKLVLAPDPVLIDLLRGLGESKEHQSLRYLLALTLLRRRVVTIDGKLDATPSGAPSVTLSGTPPDATSERAVLRLRVLSDSSTIDVATCVIPQHQTEELEISLQELLYCEAGE